MKLNKGIDVPANERDLHRDQFALTKISEHWYHIGNHATARPKLLPGHPGFLVYAGHIDYIEPTEAPQPTEAPPTRAKPAK